MRNLFYCVVVLVMVLAIASCQENKEANIVFERVEGMMDECPDSALAILDSMRTESEGYPRSQRMRYELLHAKAQNKAYVDFTTDSVMKEVVEYYDDHGTPNEQMEAHYLLGCVYRDLKESPMALSCYLDATEKADTLSEDCNYDALMRVWGQIADEYDRQAMPLKELEALEKYRSYAKMNNDTLNYIVGIELIKRPLFMIGDTVNAIKQLEKAIQFYQKNGYSFRAKQILFTLVTLYLHHKDYLKADSLINIYDKKLNILLTSNRIKGQEYYFYTKGLYYESKGNLDSAYANYKKLSYYDYKYDAYKGLLSVFSKKAMPDSTIRYCLLLEEELRVIYSDLHPQAMFNAEGVFNYSRNQRIAAEKTIAAERNRNNAILIGVLSLIIIFLLVRYTIKKKRELQTLESECIAMKEDYLKSLQDYNLMESDFEAYKAMKSAEMQELEEKWEMASARLFRADRDDVISAVRDNEAIENILNKEKYRLGYTPEITEAEWQDAYDAVKNNYPRFYSSVIINPELSDQERKVALLSLLGMGTKAIAYMMHSTPSTISNAKTSINNKLFSGDSAKTLRGNFVYL